MTAAITDIDEIQEQIQRVVAENPELSSYGWAFNSRSAWNSGASFESNRAAMLTPGFALQVADSIAYINRHGIGRNLGSYTMKHLVENECDRYVPNGAAIVAAILRGYLPLRDPGSPNCTFKKARK